MLTPDLHGNRVQPRLIDVRDAAVDARQLFVVAPALVRVGLSQCRQVCCPLGVRALQDGETSLGRDEVLDGIDGVLESSLKGCPPSISLAGTGRAASNRSSRVFWWDIDFVMSMPWAMHVL